MSYRRLCSFFLATICGILPLSMAQDKTKPVDPSGTWRWEYEMNGETLKDSLKLNLGKDGQVLGTYHGRSEKPITIKEGKVVGDRLTFQFPLEFDGNSLVLKFNAKLIKDEADGNVVISNGGESQDLPWKPKRSVLMDDVIGDWLFRIETPDGELLEPTLVVSKTGEKYTGKYSSPPDVEAQVKELKVNDNQFLFTLDTEIEGNKVKAIFKGRPYGDKIQGKVAYEIGDQSGEIEFTGRRIPAAK